MTGAEDVDWGGRELLYGPVVRLLGGLLRLLCSVRVGGERLPTSGAVVLAANHVHHVDAVVLADAAQRHGRRVRFLALTDLWEVPVLGWVLREGRMIPVRRGAGPQRMVDDAGAALAAGQAVLVYPEGHLPREGEPWPAQAGAGLLALAAAARGVPVVPVAVWGFGRDSAGRWRRRIGVVIGSPVVLDPWLGRTDASAATAAATALMDSVRGLLPDAAALARGRRRRD